MDSYSIVAIYQKNAARQKQSAEVDRFVRETGAFPYEAKTDTELESIISNHEQCDTIILLARPQQETLDFCLSLRKIEVYDFTSEPGAGTE